MPTLYVICGSPGSGKATVAALLAAQESATIVCPDIIREYRPEWTNTLVFHRAYAEVRCALSAGNHVVFDATNILPSWRRPLIAAVHRFQPQLTIICVHMTTSLQQCLNWHHQRQQMGVRQDLADDQLGWMHELLRLNPPTLAEGFDLLVEFDPSLYVLPQST